MATRYWIGGTGDWSDTAHWSDVDGGTGGFSVPSTSDTAILTSNGISGSQTLTLDIDISIVTLKIGCGIFDDNNKNVTLSGALLIEEGASSHITGDVTLKMGSGTWTINANFVAIWRIVKSTYNLSLVCNPNNNIFIYFYTGTADFFHAGIVPSYGHLTTNGIITTGGNLRIFNDGYMYFQSITITGAPTRMQLPSGQPQTVFTQHLTMHGSAGNLIRLTSSNQGQHTYLSSATKPHLSYVDAEDNVALGVLPFDNRVGGVDSGDNVDWCFPTHCSGNFYLQNVFMVGADDDGKVQTLNIGKSDDGTPIYYELERQDIELGNRAHLKKVANQIAIFTRFGAQSNVQAKTDLFPYKDIPLVLSDRVNIGDKIDLEGHWLTFKWFGSSTTVSPVFEGIYLEDVNDFGITHG